MASVTGLSNQAEQRYQERLQLRLARRYEPMYAREIFNTMKKLARAYGNTGETAGVMAEHKAAIKNIVTSEYAVFFRAFGPRLINSVEKSYKNMEVKREVPATDMFDRMQNLWIIQNAATAVTQITGTTQEQANNIIQDAVSQGVRDGLGEVQTAALIRESISEIGGNLSQFRSRMIARTEGHNAQMASQDVAARTLELPMVKTWVASSGERTRDDHRKANGQSVNMNDAFVVGGERLMYPGDSSGSAEQVINCRCVSIYEVR